MYAIVEGSDIGFGTLLQVIIKLRVSMGPPVQLSQWSIT